jgi:hypothetical protein
MSSISDVRRDIYLLEEEFRQKMNQFTNKHGLILKLDMNIYTYGRLGSRDTIDYQVKLIATVKS